MKLYIIRHQTLLPLLHTLQDRAAEASHVSLPIYMPRYLARCLASKRESAALSFLASAVMLKEILGITKDEEVTLTEIRKPYLADGRCFFSLSHDEEFTILTVDEREHGCDIERISDIPGRIANRTFPPVYMQELTADPSPANITRLWTQVEAVLKAEGTGFTCSLQEHPELLDRWFVHSSSFEGYSISIAGSEDFSFPAITEIRI